MTREPLSQLQIADLFLNVPVHVTYGLNNNGETFVNDVRVVHGPLSLDITALLTEDDFFDIFEQLNAWYVERDSYLIGGDHD